MFTSFTDQLNEFMFELLEADGKKQNKTKNELKTYICTSVDSLPPSGNGHTRTDVALHFLFVRDRSLYVPMWYRQCLPVTYFFIGTIFSKWLSRFIKILTAPDYVSCRLALSRKISTHTKCIAQFTGT